MYAHLGCNANELVFDKHGFDRPWRIGELGTNIDRIRKAVAQRSSSDYFWWLFNGK